jgi:hypothetical protein
MSIFAPVRANEEVETIRKEICDGGNVGLTGFAADRVQQQDGLGAKTGAEATTAEPDGECVYCHEGFQKKCIHIFAVPVYPRILRTCTALPETVRSYFWQDNLSPFR